MTGFGQRRRFSSMKSFFLLLASSIALGIHAQAAVDQEALRAELDAAYKAFEEAASARDAPSSYTHSQTTLRLTEELFGPDHPDTARATYAMAYRLRPSSWGRNPPPALYLAEMALEKHEAAFGADSEETFLAIRLMINFLAFAVYWSPELPTLINRAEAIATASDNPEMLENLYLDISKYPLERREHFAKEALRLTNARYGPKDARTLVAAINVGRFQESGNQAQYYEQILALSKDVEDFGEQLFGLHQKLAILYIKSGDETKVTEHIQAAGLLKSESEWRPDMCCLPLVKRPPKYPRRAEREGIEGYVLLEYVVTRTGAVRDPVVIESSERPRDIYDDRSVSKAAIRTAFAKAAIRAVLQYRYVPQYVNGEPIEVQGVRGRIAFGLRD